MRILFTCQPSTGHLLPLLGLARAARDSGLDAAILTHAETAALAPDLEVLPAGVSIAEGMAEVEVRGFPSPPEGVPGAVEMFAGVMVDLGFDEALDRARTFAPDLIVSDRFHVLGSVIGAALGVPWVGHEVSGGLPSPLEAALDDRAARQCAERDLKSTPRIALVDPYPELLHVTEPGWAPAVDRIAVRPTTYGGDERPLTRAGDRPTALVTFGTTVGDPDGLATAVASAVEAGFDVIVTERAEELPRSFDPSRVRAVGFTPLAVLLPAVDVVVTTGGTGTVLATLAAGLPLVIRPVLADQPFNAARVSAGGLGLTIENFAGAGAAVAAVLDDDAVLARTQLAARAIAAIDSPQVALDRLLDASWSGR